MLRPVERVITAHRQREGGGFLVRRPLPAPGLRMVDPILMIDEMGPVDYAPGEAVGAPDHPHRGFETVTYMLAGEFEHRDSAGHAGSLRPGDVQWMTAGRGVVHSEMPSARILREGGRVHGFQIWVNLPASLKMTQPRYQEMEGSDIPVVVNSDGLARVRIIAGEALGVESHIDTHTPIVCLHWTLQPGARVEQALPVDHNGLVYVFAGELKSDGIRIADGQMAVLGAGDVVELDASAGSSGNTQALLLGGVPINEPVVQRGPFVMNTEAEIATAIHDYESGRMGAIESANAD
jgi:redox-sensitive bicupin YhaK (pirin superfamily)